MKVEIDVTVKVVGASIEEALARMTEKLLVIRPTDAEREQYAKEYHYREEEYGYDLDWRPFSIINRTADGEVTSSMDLRIWNV